MFIKTFVLKGFFLFSFFYFSSQNSHSLVRVAFIEQYNIDGSLHQVEAEGNFSHLAISFGQLWLHAFPPRGVQLWTTEMLEKIGKIKVIIELQDADEPLPSDVYTLLYKSYDWSFEWDTVEAWYCSKLVAKFLNIPPNPMYFDPRFWHSSYAKYNGRPGKSPNGVYNALMERRHKKIIILPPLLSRPEKLCQLIF